MIAPVDLSILAIAAVSIAVVPRLLGASRRWGQAQALFWSVTVVVAGCRMFLDLPSIGSLFFASIFAGLVLLLVGLVLTEPDLRWSSRHAAIATTIVYLLLIPHMLQWPVDGDEPYFALVAESLARDADFDLANQYENLERSETGRLDLRPQLGDPVGARGELYSRHEPFLSILLIPGLLLGGMPGAVAVIALLGGLLTRSVLKLLEEQGLPDAARSIVWPAISLAPPVLFYATRIWTEVPGALALSEAIRAMLTRRWKAFTIWLALLSLLQLRFALLALALLALAIWHARPKWTTVGAGLAALTLPLLTIWFASGRPFGVHGWFELLPGGPVAYLRGSVGLLVDAQAGLLFQAPMWLLGLAGVLRAGDRMHRRLWLIAVPYLFLLVPRGEWHGGWSPPLRYLVVFAPLFALSLAAAVRRLPRAVLISAAAWSAGLAIHGIAFPWRLFHIASGESVMGEWLSRTTSLDFGRILPSLIRPNAAAIVWSLMLACGMIALLTAGRRVRSWVVASVASAVVAVAAIAAKAPPSVVHLEDAHVRHDGGELHPERYTPIRFAYRGGWAMPEGSTATFEMRPGPAVLHYSSSIGATVEIGGSRYELPPTKGWGTFEMQIPEPAVVMRISGGSAIIDRIVHD